MERGGEVRSFREKLGLRFIGREDYGRGVRVEERGKRVGREGAKKGEGRGARVLGFRA